MYDYLNDQLFLKKLDKYNVKNSFARITLLTFNESPIKEIQGTITSGSLNVNGSAAIRRTINLTMAVTSKELDLTNIDNDISLNKKIKVEIGYKNPFMNKKEYSEYGNIIWFPCGVFLVSQASTSRSTNNWTISLSGKDKMVLLDGSVGGILPASVTFHEYYEKTEDGNYIVKKPTIFQIIQETVNHYGKEDLNNILISDIPNEAKLLIKYMGDSPIYFSDDFTSFQYFPSTGYKTNIYKKTQDVGYQKVPFVYPGELVLDAGNSVANVLEKIASILGNFEFFYDVNGRFVFQQKKNFLNIQSPFSNNLKPEDYLTSYSNTKYQYSLTDPKTIVSISQNPKYDNIKNDFIVWGKRETATGSEKKIRYRLAIDSKPRDKKYINDNLPVSLCHLFMIEIREKRNKKVIGHILSRELPDLNNLYWKIPNKNFRWNNNDIILEKKSYWNKDAVFPEVDLTWNDEKDDNPKDNFYWNDTDEELGKILFRPLEFYPNISKDKQFEWREELYRQAVCRSIDGISLEAYDAELLAEWRKIYDPEKSSDKEDLWKDGWNPMVFQNPSGLDYWLDFIDTNSPIGKYSVNAIGRRTKVVTDNNINSICNNQIPDVIFLPKNDENFNKDFEKYTRINQKCIPIMSKDFQQFAPSATKASAFDKIKELLSQHLKYNSQITISCLPRYYMEPNNIIYLEDPETGIIGNYEITQFTLPLNYSGMMNITANEVLVKI